MILKNWICRKKLLSLYKTKMLFRCIQCFDFDYFNRAFVENPIKKYHFCDRFSKCRCKSFSTSKDFLLGKPCQKNDGPLKIYQKFSFRA